MRPLRVIAVSCAVAMLVAACSTATASPAGVNSSAVRLATQADVGYGWGDLTAYAGNHIYVALHNLCGQPSGTAQAIVLNPNPKGPGARWTCSSLDALGKTVIVIRQGYGATYILSDPSVVTKVNPDAAGADLICSAHDEGLDLSHYFNPTAVSAYLRAHCRA